MVNISTTTKYGGRLRITSARGSIPCRDMSKTYSAYTMILSPCLWRKEVSCRAHLDKQMISQ